jgi:hypothetical protein
LNLCLSVHGFGYVYSRSSLYAVEKKANFLLKDLSFEVSMAVTMKNARDVMPCGFVRTDVSDERITSIRVTRIGELESLAVTSMLQLHILAFLMMKAIRSSETSVLKRTTLGHIPGNGILLSFSKTFIQDTELDRTAIWTKQFC